MSLVKSRELFVESAFPIAVDRVVDRTLMQKELHRHEYFEMLFVKSGSLINTGYVVISAASVTHSLTHSRHHSLALA